MLQSVRSGLLDQLARINYHLHRPHLPIPRPRNLASSTSTGHDKLDLVFGALLRFATWAPQVSAAAASVGPMATLLPELLVTDPAALRAWLEEHHATSPGVRLVLTKKGGSDTTITWASAVEELLCFGWIDGQAGKRDEDSYTVRITPRRPKGSWSQRNVALVATLEEQGRMTDAGRAAVEAARADGRWDAAYAGPATRQVPADLAAAIAAEPEAQAMFDVLTSANRFALIHRVESMKRADSRARKISEMVEMLARGETLYPQKAGHPGRAGQGVDARQ